MREHGCTEYGLLARYLKTAGRTHGIDRGDDETTSPFVRGLYYQVDPQEDQRGDDNYDSEASDDGDPQQGPIPENIPLPTSAPTTTSDTPMTATSPSGALMVLYLDDVVWPDGADDEPAAGVTDIVLAVAAAGTQQSTNGTTTQW
ncbi:MAG: hypothetical protein M1826_004244 [Phylliscum demangeonii]|nr:MAG: hypothetical protein M1826_004244 [Phylliscum demangeonii]